MKKKTILFIYRNFSTFVKKDYEILKEKYDATPLHATKNLIKTLAKFAWNIRESDLVFIWFAGWHAFLAVLFAKLLRKKSIVMIGGYDAACVPEINYGVFCSWWRGKLTKFVYKNVDKILVVDKSLKKEILKNSGLEIREKIVTVPTCYDSDRWKPKGKKKGIVLTVGNKPLVKGLDTFHEIALKMPKIEFIAIGFKENFIKKYRADNIKFIPHIPSKQLLKYYQKAKVYCQLSRHEGLPNALCEAMLCECVPVGTKVNGTITAIGDTGYLVDRDIEEIKRAIESAMSDKGEKCRERIKKLFPLERRRRELIYHISELLK